MSRNSPFQFTGSSRTDREGRFRLEVPEVEGLLSIWQESSEVWSLIDAVGVWAAHGDDDVGTLAAQDGPSHGRRIRCAIMDTSGQPLSMASARLAAHEEAGPIPWLEPLHADVRGRIDVEAFEYARWHLDIECEGYAPQRVYANARRDLPGRGDEWFLVRLAPGRIVSGCVVDEAGVPASNCWVGIYAESRAVADDDFVPTPPDREPDWELAWCMVTDEDGRFAASVRRDERVALRASRGQSQDDKCIEPELLLEIDGHTDYTITLPRAEAGKGEK